MQKCSKMSPLVPLVEVGGSGGSPFTFTGEDNGATLRKIWVWTGVDHVKAVQVWLTDGGVQKFGKEAGDVFEFEFQDGEKITSLTLWANGVGTRLGGIKFETNHPREFFAKPTIWVNTKEYPIDVGSGICLGVVGRSGSDLDKMGFLFINTVKSTVLTDVKYTTIHKVTPKIVIEVIQSSTYTNDTEAAQSYTVETKKAVTPKSSWSLPNKIESMFNVIVQAGIPDVVEGPNGLYFKVGEESSYDLESTDKTIENLTVPVEVLSNKSVEVEITIGRVTVDLPYTGTVEVTCDNGGVLKINTNGEYNGVTYNDVKTVVKDK